MMAPIAQALSDAVTDQVVARAADPHYPRWEQQLRQVGYCSRPVRLAGKVAERDTDGTWRLTYSTADEPDGCLLKACGQRRATVCPSCSAVYQCDAFQLLVAGLRGGKGVPESVAHHPALFVTFTAPGFGPVHARREHGGKVQRCHPRRDEICPHGRRLHCGVRHGEDDEAVGSPICADCFDYEGAVIWNRLAPELWRRTTMAIRRSLARQVGITNKEMDRVVRVSYSKVVEYQRRGLVHFHAVFRLDAAAAAGQPEIVEAPPERFSAEVLEQALRTAVATVSAPSPGGDYVRWGDQLDVRAIAEAGPASLSRGAVAGYVAKYATKSTDPLGRLDSRIKSLEDLRARGVSAHVQRLAETAWRLGEHEDLAELKLRQWAHTLGFGGHWMTKSRRYSTTFAALRQARAEWTVERQPRGQSDRRHESSAVGQWRLVGIGYRTDGDRLLAESAAARAREQRLIARGDGGMSVFTKRPSGGQDAKAVAHAGGDGRGHGNRTEQGVRASQEWRHRVGADRWESQDSRRRD